MSSLVKLPTLCMSVTRWLSSHARCWGAVSGGWSIAREVPVRLTRTSTDRQGFRGKSVPLAAVVPAWSRGGTKTWSGDVACSSHVLSV